jgi:hypothetical protein
LQLLFAVEDGRGHVLSHSISPLRLHYDLQ